MFDRINQAIARTGLKLISRSGAFDASELKESTTVLTNAQVVALRATPVTVVAAPGAGKFAEFVSALLVFNRTAAYTAGAGDDLAFRFNNTTGTVVATAEATGFLTAAGDAVTFATPSAAPNVTAAGELSNGSIVLHNSGVAEFGAGNAANTVKVVVTYRVHATEL